jgi:hypothetical protein
MMRGSQESQPLNIKTIVSLNTLMIDGTGMCGVCRSDGQRLDEVRLRRWPAF